MPNTGNYVPSDPDEVAEYLIDSIELNLQVEAAADEMQSRRSRHDEYRMEATLPKPVPGQLNPSKRLSNMDEPTIEAWYLDQAFTRFGTRRTAAIFGGVDAPGSGFDAIREEVLRDTSNRIARRIEVEGDRPTYAFNNETREWPHIARAYLADHEAHISDRDGDYREECERFANMEGVWDHETGQCTLDMFYPEHPLGPDSDLSNQEAKTVLLARAVCGNVDQDFLAEIDNYHNFRNLLKQVENVDAALRAAQYDGNAPIELTSQLAAPEEWPDDMDPQDMRSGPCCSCGDVYYEVYHHEDGRTWVSETGEAMKVYHHDDDSPFYHRSPEQFDDPLLCDICQAESFDTNDKVTIIDEDGNAARISRYRDMLWDAGEADDRPGLVPRDEVPEEYLERGFSILGGHHGMADHFLLSPQHSDHASDEQYEALAKIAKGEENPFEGGPVYIREAHSLGEPEHNMILRRDEPQIARQAKDVLEHPEAILDDDIDHGSVLDSLTTIVE